MGTTITLAKLTPPRLGNVYARTRLFKQLDAMRKKSPLIWISATAGAGKTILAASYLKTRGLSPLWYQIDEGDHDPASFFYHLRLAAQKAAPRRKPLPLLTPEYLAGLPAYTRNFFRDLYPRLRRPGVLVLDNYQEVASSAILHELLASGFSEIPDKTHVIVLSRAEPPASFARLAANGHIAHLDWRALQLTEEEARGITRLRQGKKFTTRTPVPTLLHQTQGWVAGLVLLLEQMRSTPMDTMLESSGDLSKVFDYFAAEIFRHTDSVTQDFLLTTSFLPKITLTAAQDLTGNTEARRVLDGLTRSNYFTVRHAEGSYEYHPLFRSFLLNQATERYTAEQIRQIQQKSAQILTAQGNVEAAVSLLMQAQDWPALVPLLLQQAPVLMGQGRMQTLSGWLQALPETIRAGNPWVLYWLGISRLMYDQPEARDCFEQAFHLFEHGEEADPLYLAWSGIANSFIVHWHDFKPLGKWLDLYPSLQGKRKPPSPDVEAASVFSFVTGLIFHRPDDPRFEAYASRAEGLFEQAVGRWLIQGASLIFGYLWVREFGKATRLLRILEPYIGTPGVEPSARILWCSLVSVHAFFVASAEECIRYSAEGLEIGEEHGLHGYDESLAGLRLVGEIMSHQIPAARKISDYFLRTAKRDTGKGSFFLICAAAVSMHEGDMTRAMEEVNESLRFDSILSNPFAVAMNRFVRAVLFGKQGDTSKALSEIEEVRVASANIRSPMLRYCGAMAEANVRYWRGEQALVLQALQEGFRVASKDGRITFPFWQLRDEASVLCNMALDTDLYTDFVQELIRKHHLPAPSSQPVAETWPFAIKIYTLGRFRVVVGDKPLAFSAKTQKKPLELLKALIALGGRGVSVEQLTEALWPEAEGDNAQRTLFTTLHRLRKLLGNDETIRIEAGKLTLESSHCWVDLWTLERLLRELDASATQTEQFDAKALGLRLSRAYRLNQGPFLRDETAPWALSARERLRQRCLRTIERLGRSFEQAQHWEQALDCYTHGVTLEPLAEDLYRQLMRCYAVLGRRAEALNTYQRCREALQQHLGIAPSTETEALRERVLQAG